MANIVYDASPTDGATKIIRALTRGQPLLRFCSDPGQSADLAPRFDESPIPKVRFLPGALTDHQHNV